MMFVAGMLVAAVAILLCFPLIWKLYERVVYGRKR